MKAADRKSDQAHPLLLADWATDAKLHFTEAFFFFFEIKTDLQLS